MRYWQEQVNLPRPEGKSKTGVLFFKSHILSFMLTSGLIRHWQRLDKMNAKATESNFKSFLNQKIAKNIQKLWAIFKPGKEGYALSLYGVHLKDRKKDVTFRFCRDGGYGSFLFELLEDIAQETTFLDIGGNVGLFSLVAEKNPNILSIHTFEPDLETIPYLESNIDRNKCRKIKLHPYALSNTEGSRNFFVASGHSGISSLHVVSETSLPAGTVECVNSQYLNQQIVISPSTRVFAKIDVEGHELFVIQALMDWNHAERIDQLFIEFDSRMSNVSALQDLLTANNFHEVRRRGEDWHWDALWRRTTS